MPDTRTYLDGQLKFSAFLPDFTTALDRMAADSEAAAAAHDLTRAAYGDDPRQWVEWMAGSGPDRYLPVILHGGYWRALEAETHRFMMSGFAGAGSAVANIEYRLVPQVRLADVVADAKAALDLLCRTFPDQALILIGHSAGAHLALSAPVRPRLEGAHQGGDRPERRV